MQCRDAPLKFLFSNDESSPEYRLFVSHVDTCAACQQRLCELSGEGGFPEEIRNAVRCHHESLPYETPSHSQLNILVETVGRGGEGCEYEPISLDFLAPASHPEMLGRIGRYDVEKVIGSGGMGVVLKGYDTELHRVVAIKVLKSHLADFGAARNRFAREARSAAAVVHEHVIPIYDVRSDGEMPFLVMQYVPGQSLQSRVEERGPLEPKEIVRIALQIASGLAAAHAQGLVHRDVKPANILMEDSVERVLISDFGLARTVDDATLTRTGIIAGTPHYMSPEQSRGGFIDDRSDLFSLGSVVYYMCTGRPPFRADNALAVLNRICLDQHRPVDEVNPEIPSRLAATVDRLLAKDPADRFHNARDVEQQFTSILLELQSGKRSGWLRWSRHWRRWRRVAKQVLVRLCLAMAFVLMGAGATWWLRSNFHGQAGNELSVPGTDLTHSISRESHRVSGTEIQSHRFAGDASETGRRGVEVHEEISSREIDKFDAEVSQLQSELSDLESRWERNGVDSVPQLDLWQQDLVRLQKAIDAFEHKVQ